MLRSFSELYKIDLTGRAAKKPGGKDGIDYLPWVDCLLLLHENGAESVKYGNIHNSAGHSLFTENGKCPEVHVFVEIDGSRYELTYPVIDGYKSIDMDKITQSNVHNATQRAFVKCVAVNTGLGLTLWEKEDQELARENINAHNLYKVIERVKKKYAAAVEQVGNAREVSGIIEISEKAIEATFKHAANLGALEDRLNGVLRRD